MDVPSRDAEYIRKRFCNSSGLVGSSDSNIGASGPSSVCSVSLLLLLLMALSLKISG